MNRDPAQLLSHLSPAERVVYMSKPTLPMPFEGSLPPLEVGEVRYVDAADGLYIQGRSPVLEITLRMREVKLSRGPLTESIRLPGGPIPLDIMFDIQRHALAHSPEEWACIVEWEPQAQRYVLREPEQVLHRSCDGIEYGTTGLQLQNMVLDLHTHGDSPPHFSHIDDHSDRCGVYFASVLGHCQSAETMCARSRVVIDDFTCDLFWHPWGRATERDVQLLMESPKFKVPESPLAVLGWRSLDPMSSLSEV